MTSTTNGTLAANVRGRRSIDASRLSKRSRNGGRTTLGALAFRAFARALAWLAFFGRAGRSTGREIGVVCGPELRLSRRADGCDAQAPGQPVDARCSGKRCPACVDDRPREAVAFHAWL